MHRRADNSKNLVHFTKDDPRINRKGAPSYKNALRAVSPKWLERMQHVLFNEPEPVFFQFLNEPDVTAAERLVAKLVQRIYISGDPTALTILLDRLVGKVADKVEVTAKNSAVDATQLSDDELNKRAALLDSAE